MIILFLITKIRLIQHALLIIPARQWLIHEIAIFRSSTLDKETAKLTFQEWYKDVNKCSLREIKAARDAVKSREDEILNYFIETFANTPHTLNIFRGDTSKTHRAGTHFTFYKCPETHKSRLTFISISNNKHLPILSSVSADDSTHRSRRRSTYFLYNKACVSTH